MAFHVSPFRNPENFAKYLLFYFEPGCNVIIRAIQWLTGGEVELKRRLKAKEKYFNKDEKEKIKKYLDGNSEFNNFDITFYFKICQYMCNLEPVSSIVWARSCPRHRQDELEHLFVKLKNGRNELAHASVYHRNLTDLQVEEKCEEMKDLLTKILEKAGEMANVNAGDIQNEVKETEFHLERVRNDKNVNESLLPHVRNLILNDLKEIYEKELEFSFQNELRGYSIPYLKKQGGSETYRLSGNHFSSRATVILGEAGAGKTALTKFLFRSWLTGNTESPEELNEFDIVLRIECSRIRSSDLNMFFEEHFLKSAFYFCNTSSLSRHFKVLKVLWIMDGFDESTPACNGFLESITSYIPQLHKVLATTREHAFETLRKYFSEIVTYNLDKLQNDNIEEILKNRINDEEKRESIMAKYNKLTSENWEFMETPIHFVMCIDHWINGSAAEEEEGATTLTKLYTASTKQQLANVCKKHQNHSYLVSEKELQLSINNWFYRSLCKRSFLNVVDCKYFLDCKEIETLEEDATKGFLKPLACLSSFLANDITKSRFDFKHSSQRLYFAALYMTKYPKDSSIGLDKFLANHDKIELIEYFIKIVCQEDAVIKDPEQKLDIINQFISSFNDKFNQDFLWHMIWISPNVRNKDYYSRAPRSWFYVDKRTLIQPSIIEYAKHVDPEKIIIDTTMLVTDIFNIILECLYQFEYGKLRIELQKRFLEDQEQEIRFHIMNRFNNAKHQFIYHEVVSNVIIHALRELYVGPEPMEKHLKDLAAIDNFCLTSRDIYLLEELSEGNIATEELNPTLLLKVGKIIYEVGIGSNFSWRKLWSSFTHGEVKFDELLSDFNSLPHDLSKENNRVNYRDIFPACDDRVTHELLNEVVAHNISSTDITNKEQELNKALTTLLSKMAATHLTSDGVTGELEKKLQRYIEESNPTIEIDFDFGLLKSILVGAGMEGSIEPFQLKLRDLSAKTNVDIISTIHAKNIIVRELIDQYEIEKRCHDHEMETYIPPTLLDNDKKKINVKDISFEDCEIIYAKAESGTGRREIERYLFTSWARGVMDSMVWLKSFDIVFVVNGNKCHKNFVPELLEFLLPRSCNIFPTTTLLMKKLEKMKVLWICENFYQCFVLSYRFKSHKFFLIEHDTSDCSYDHYYKMVTENDINIKSYKIYSIRSENIDIFLSERVPLSKFFAIRKSVRSRLDECNTLLHDEFHLSLYVEILLNETKNSLQLYSEGELTETMLLVNYTYLQLQRLKDSCGYSESKVDNWFYGSLCKHCFRCLKVGFTPQCFDLNLKQEDAMKENLDTEMCLDFFFIKELRGSEGVSYGFIHDLQPYILASFFLRRWKVYPPFLEEEDVGEENIETTVRVLNTFIIMAIYEDINKTFAIETASKVASAYALKDECLIWYRICEMNNFREKVMKFVTNILGGFDCFVLHYEIQNISGLVKFFKSFTPKAIRFISMHFNKYEFNKEAYLDLLNVLEKKQIDIEIKNSKIIMVEASIQYPGREFFGIKVLELINDAASLNITSFEGEVPDLLPLRNHFGKLKKLDLVINSVDCYNELCRDLPKMAQLEEINLSFYYSLPLNKIYPDNFVTLTTVRSLRKEIFEGCIEMIQRIKGETTLKFKQLVTNWWCSRYGTPDGRYEPRPEYVNLNKIINDLFSSYDYSCGGDPPTEF